MRNWPKYTASLALIATASLATAQSTVPPANHTSASTGQILGQASTSLPLFTPEPATVAAATKAADTQPDTQQTTQPESKPHKKRKPVSAKDRDRAENFSAEGDRALLADNPRKAVEDFHRAAELDPDNKRFVADEAIANEHLVTQLVQQAEKARLRGDRAAARQDLSAAFHLDPHNPEVTQHYADLIGAEHDSAFEDASDVKLAEPPIALNPLPGMHSFHFRATAQDVVRTVMRAYGILPTFESSVINQSVRFDADDVDYAQAAHLLTLVTNTFIVPLDPARVLLVTDSKENREKYQRLAMETIYLPGLSEADRGQVGQIARDIFQIQSATAEPSQSTLTLRAPQQNLKALNTTLTGLLQGQSQILLNVKLLEVDLTRTKNAGFILPSQTTLFNIPSEVSSLISSNASLVQQIISSGLASPTDYLAIAAILIASGQVTGTPFNQPFGYFGGGLTETGVSYSGGSTNAALNTSDVHTLDQMQLMAMDQQDEEVRSGTRYPIITSSYSNLAGSNLSIAGISSPGVSSALQALGLTASSLTSTSETIPQVQYEDLGLTLHVTPYVAGNGNVSLKLDLKIDSLEGTSLNDIPILDDREVNAVAALRPGSSALLVSSVSKQDSDAINGIPGINELPGLEGGTNQNDTKDITELAIVITPYLVRRVHAARADPMILLSQH